MDVDGEGPVYAVAGVGLDAILEVGEVQSGADGTHVDTVMGGQRRDDLESPKMQGNYVLYIAYANRIN